MLDMMATDMSRTEALRDWLREIAFRHGTSLHGIARAAGIHGSTLTRFMDPDGPGHNLSDTSISKIERAFNSSRPAAAGGTQTGASGPRRLQERPAGLLNPQAEMDEIASAIERAHQGDSAQLDAYLVRDRTLDLAGYLPGDVILVDPSRAPQPGDVVALQPRGTLSQREGVMVRIWDAPWLTAHSTDVRCSRPMLIDPQTATILGVVTTALRHRSRT